MGCKRSLVRIQLARPTESSGSATIISSLQSRSLRLTPSPAYHHGMRATLTLWATPQTLRDALRDGISPEAIEDVTARLKAYVDAACKPLLRRPPGDVTDLVRGVEQQALRTMDLRLDYLSALARSITGPEQLERALFAAGRALTDFREAARHLLDQGALECFEMGTRINMRGLARVLKYAREHPEPPFRSDQRSLWYSWMHVSSCLDLCVMSVLVYIEEDRSVERAAVAGELCWLVKELALAWGALEARLLPRGSGTRESVTAELSAADVAWDTAFSNVIVGDIGRLVRGG